MSVKENSKKADNLTDLQLDNSAKIAAVKGRISSLVDDVHSIKLEIDIFKKAVSNDMKLILDQLNANR